MINRVLIRLKIIQIVYAYYQNGSKNLDSAEKELFFSLSKAYDLYNYLLMLMIDLYNLKTNKNSVDHKFNLYYCYRTAKVDIFNEFPQINHIF